MSDIEWVFVILVVWNQGVLLGYILWAPMTVFKRSFIDTLTFKWLWNKLL